MYGIEKKKQKRFIDLNVPLRVMTGYCFEMLYQGHKAQKDHFRKVFPGKPYRRCEDDTHFNMYNF